jgi:hypothetical protein
MAVRTAGPSDAVITGLVSTAASIAFSFAATAAVAPTVGCGGTGGVLRCGIVAPGAGLQCEQVVDAGGLDDGEIDGLVALLALEVLISLAPIELDVQLAFELAGLVALLRHDEGGGDALGSGSTCASDAVDEVFTCVRQIVVDDVRDVGDVDAAGGDVSGHEHAVLAAGEALESRGALRLRAVAMDGVRVVAEFLQLA